MANITPPPQKMLKIKKENNKICHQPSHSVCSSKFIHSPAGSLSADHCEIFVEPEKIIIYKTKFRSLFQGISTFLQIPVGKLDIFKE